jgi:hypothetical protein
MGHDLYAGTKEINFSSGSHLIVGWCQMFMADTAHPEIGETYIPVEAVKTANNVIPLSFETVQTKGYLPDYFYTTQDEFEECREFLTYAAQNNLEIRGRW